MNYEILSAETAKKLKQQELEIERLKKELKNTKEHLGEYLHEQEEENKKLKNELERYKEIIFICDKAI